MTETAHEKKCRGKDLYTSVKKSTQPGYLNIYKNTNNPETCHLIGFFLNCVICWLSEHIFINLAPIFTIQSVQLNTMVDITTL